MYEVVPCTHRFAVQLGELVATSSNTVDPACQPLVTSYTFEIVGGLVDHFNVVELGSQSFLRLSQNNERLPRLEVVVRVTDGRGQTFDKLLTVRVGCLSPSSVHQLVTHTCHFHLVQQTDHQLLRSFPSWVMPVRYQSPLTQSGVCQPTANVPPPPQQTTCTTSADCNGGGCLGAPFGYCYCPADQVAASPFANDIAGRTSILTATQTGGCAGTKQIVCNGVPLKAACPVGQLVVVRSAHWGRHPEVGDTCGAAANGPVLCGGDVTTSLAISTCNGAQNCQFNSVPVLLGGTPADCNGQPLSLLWTFECVSNSPC